MAAKTQAIMLAARQALYGDMEASAEFARDLKVNSRAVRNWISGKNEAPPDVLQRVYTLLAARRKAIDAAVGAIERHLAGQRE